MNKIVTGFLMDISQNNVYNIDRKLGLANRLGPISLITVSEIRSYMLRFDTSENDVITNQDLGV